MKTLKNLFEEANSSIICIDLNDKVYLYIELLDEYGGSLTNDKYINLEFDKNKLCVELFVMNKNKVGMYFGTIMEDINLNTSIEDIKHIGNSYYNCLSIVDKLYIKLQQYYGNDFTAEEIEILSYAIGKAYS